MGAVRKSSQHTFLKLTHEITGILMKALGHKKQPD